MTQSHKPQQLGTDEAPGFNDRNRRGRVPTCIGGFGKSHFATSAFPIVWLACWLWGSALGSYNAIAAEVQIIEGASEPHVTVSDQGQIYVVVNWKRDIALVASKDGGKNFTKPVVAIDSGGRASHDLQRGPRVGVDAEGRVFVTGFARFDKTPDLFLTTSNDGGSAWTEPARINDLPGVARHALHWMSVTPSGQAHIAWLDIRSGRQIVDLFYAHVSGGVVSKNMKIATNVCECCAPGVDVDAQGNPIIAFREGGDKDSRELFHVHSADFGETFSAPMQLNQLLSLEDG